MPTAYLYVRVSTDDQVRFGHSLEAQRLRAMEYYERILRPAGIELGEVFVEEGESAYKTAILQRTKGRVLNERLQRGDHVVFVMFDRAFRTQKDFVCTSELWQMRGISLHFMNLQIDGSTPTGRAMLQIMAAVAELESGIRSERAKATHKIRRMRGLPEGGIPPQGFRVVGSPGKKRLTPDYEMRALMQEVVRLKDQEGLSFTKVSERMRARVREWRGDKPAPKNNPWYNWKFWTSEVASNTYHREKKLQAKEARQKKNREDGEITPLVPYRLVHTKRTEDTPALDSQDSEPSPPPADSDGSEDHQDVA